MKKDQVELNTKAYRFGRWPCLVSISKDPIQLETIDEAFPWTNSLIVADEHTVDIVQRFLGPRNLQTPILVLAAGEHTKTWTSVDAIIRAARQAAINRDGRILAVGGGVITDLVGFAASVYLRGIGLWLIPTSLLAMVDAAIGGKTGFDFDGYKNLVGSFRPADRVLIASDCLSSLPQGEWLSGMAEVIKTALIGDDNLVELIYSHQALLKLAPIQAETANPGLAELLPKIIEGCLSIKAEIVTSDPEERGSRRVLLNLGHSFGHALETVVGLGRLSHGEAVAWGIARAVVLSQRLGRISPDRARFITELLAAFGYCIEPLHPALTSTAAYDQSTCRQQLLAAMSHDKKRTSQSWRLVIPLDQAVTVVEVDKKDLESVFRSF